MKRQQRVGQDRRGAALVEMALVFPIFLTVLLGIVEFGRAMMVGQLITNASREGARLGVINGNSNADVQSHVLDFLTETLGVGEEDLSVTITVTPAPGNDTIGNEVSNAQQRDLVTVRVTVPFSKVSYITGSYLEGKSLTGESSMRHE